MAGLRKCVSALKDLVGSKYKHGEFDAIDNEICNILKHFLYKLYRLDAPIYLKA